MKLTVVICTFNRSELLEKTVRSLNAAKRPANADIELLVIANHCSDDTIYRLDQWRQEKERQQTLPLRFAEEPIPGKSYALNRAIDMIESGFLCFVDDDHRIDPDFFCAIETAIHQYPDYPIFCGKIIPDWTGEEPAWLHETGQYKIYPSPVPHFEMGDQTTDVTLETALPGGGNLIVRKSVFGKTGYFATSLGPKGHNLAGSEDSDFILRALNAGFSIRYCPEIIQYHYVDPERLKNWYLIRKCYQRSRTLTRAKLGEASPVPRYLWRKAAENLIQCLFSLNRNKSRFHAMRTASSIGEIVGHWGKAS